MVDESVKKFFSFFFQYGWLIFIILLINEKWGFQILNFLNSDYQFVSFMTGVFICIIALGIPATIIGIAGKTDSALIGWSSPFLYICIAIYLFA